MPQYLHSLSRIAVMAQLPVPAVQRLLTEIGAEPELCLDLTPFYDAEVVGTVVARANGWVDQPAYGKTFFAEVRGDA
jgi:hypothetical protein